MPWTKGSQSPQIIAKKPAWLEQGHQQQLDWIYGQNKEKEKEKEKASELSEDKEKTEAEKPSSRPVTPPGPHVPHVGT